LGLKLRLKIILAVLFALVTGHVSAEEVTASSKSRLKLPNSYTKLLDGRLATQYEGSKRLLPKSTGIPRYTGSYNGEYLAMAEQAAALFGVPKDLFTRLIQAESGWNPKAVSPAGAIGLAQLLPETARKMGVDPHDPKANLEGGALYLKQQFMRFRSWKLALAAYNAGPEAVEKYDDVPPFAETQAYVLAILGPQSGG